MGGTALGCAYFYVLGVLVVPLALLGLLTGLGGLVLGLRADRPRYVLASAGSVLNALLLTAALASPVLLGPTYQLARAPVEAEVVVPRLVPLAGAKTAPGEEKQEWPDATRFAVQIKKARVQVVTATVRPLEIGAAAKDKPKKLTKQSYLVLRVRTHQSAGGVEFRNGAWQEGAAQRPQPTLADNTGKTYAQPSIDGVLEAGGLSQKPSAFPLGISDDVFVFDAPAPTVQFLRLEMPAAAWGATGAIRFSIPRAMLETEPRPGGMEKKK
jgi:hypothetical protein